MNEKKKIAALLTIKIVVLAAAMAAIAQAVVFPSSELFNIGLGYELALMSISICAALILVEVVRALRALDNVSSTNSCAQKEEKEKKE